MVDYGMFYAYWARDWETTPAEMIERVTTASDLGFDILEIHCDALLDWDTDERARLRTHAEDHDVELTFDTTLTEDTDVSAHDAAVRERGVDRVTEAIELVDEMGGSYLGGINYGPWNPEFDGGLDEKAARTDRAVETYREVADVAETNDVIVSVEVVNRFEQFMLNTAAEARSFVDRVDSPNVQIMLDTFHMNIEEDDMAAAIETAGDRLGHFHVGENNRRPPRADGNMPWTEIGEALRAIDYDGPVVMEPFMLPGGSVAPDIGIWRDLSEGVDLDETAAESRDFLQGVVEG
jgi:D-psicose/D-tagatose/L-ribulose 3-epimerase